MKKIYCALFIMLGCLQMVKAQYVPTDAKQPTSQDGRHRKERRAPKPKPVRPVKQYRPVPLGFNLGTNLGTLAEMDGGPSLHAEYRFKQTMSVSLETMAILYDASQTFERDKGYRIRPEFRYFFTGRRGVYHFFTGVEVSYKRAVVSQGWLTTKNGLDQDTYQEMKLYRNAKEDYEAGIKFGAQYFFGKSRHFMFEYSIGLALKYRNMHYLDRPPASATSIFDLGGYDIGQKNDNYYDPHTHWHPSVPFTVKLAYRF